MTPRNVVTSMPESSYFRTLFESQCIHGCKTLLRPALQHFYPNFPLSQNKLSWKISALVISEILGLFGNTLTADNMYSRHNWQKFWQQVQAILSQKLKQFLHIILAFLQSPQNFVHFEKKDRLHSLNISEVIDPEKCGYFNARKFLF